MEVAMVSGKVVGKNQCAHAGEGINQVAFDLASRAFSIIKGGRPEDLANWTDSKWSQWRDHSDGSVW